MPAQGRGSIRSRCASPYSPICIQLMEAYKLLDEGRAMIEEASVSKLLYGKSQPQTRNTHLGVLNKQKIKCLLCGAIIHFGSVFCSSLKR